jgi:cytochrome c peroxidase
MLSGNNDRSCSTCHSPAALFSDRLRRNKNREGTGDLPRNTPSLLYAAYQYNQFWDGRVMTLSQQAITVMNDTLEMKGSGEDITKKISRNASYQALFRKIWETEPAVTEEHIASALAAYERTLTPFHSAFDRYMAGDRSALSQSQKRGFNIFMGKALCGTCHFAPLFNGLLPPLYNVTEFEILGTPATDDLLHPQPDPDTGQARVMSFLAHGSFKTPTVRNAAMTAPYMHNGGFRSLETVIEFYDKGGGQGIGLDTPGQTLSPQPLQLDSVEKADLKAFIGSLTDK